MIIKLTSNIGNTYVYLHHISTCIQSMICWWNMHSLTYLCISVVKICHLSTNMYAPHTKNKDKLNSLFNTLLMVLKVVRKGKLVFAIA